MFRRVYILFAVFLLAIAVSAQIPMRSLTREQIDSILNPALHADASRTLFSDIVSFDLGKLNETDNPVSRTFRLRNVSKSLLRIARVRTTCGCTVADHDTMSIAAGDEVAGAVARIVDEVDIRADLDDVSAFKGHGWHLHS